MSRIIFFMVRATYQAYGVRNSKNATPQCNLFRRQTYRNRARTLEN
jgi:hypothetical protein